MKVTWVGSPNYSPGRDGHNPNWTEADPNTWIVLHTMVGTEAAARARFQNPAQQASSTYGVCLDGSIVQYVREEDAAWANGTYADNPGSNLDSISIEHEDDGDYNGPRTPALYEASAQLLADISRRRGIPLVHRASGGGVLVHHECGPHGIATGCPDGLDYNRIIARANEILHPPPPPPPPVPAPPPPTPTPPPVTGPVPGGETSGAGPVGQDPGPSGPGPGPTPVPQPQPGTSWQDWLANLADHEIVALIEYFKEHLAKRSGG